MMLDSMEQFKDLVVGDRAKEKDRWIGETFSLQPGSEEQCEKLRMIINSLSEQQTGYVNLLNLINVRGSTKRMSLLIVRSSFPFRSPMKRE